MHDLRRSLADYDMAMLRALAASRGVDLDTNVQGEAAGRLAEALRDPVSVRTAVARLSARARDALDALLAAGGRMHAPQFARTFGQVRLIGPGRLAREAPWQTPANAAEELWYAGLVFYAFADDPAGPVEFVYVPQDVQPLLPHPGAEGLPFPVDTVADPAAPSPAHPTLVEDLFQYLSFIQNRDVHLDAGGHLLQADRQRLQRRTPWAGDERQALVHHLALRLGFVMRRPGDAFLQLDAGPVKRWLTDSRAQQLAQLQDAWRDDPTWSDLCHVPGLECDTETAWHQHYDPVPVRRAILGLLARCPRDAWWSLASFIHAVKVAEPDFQRPDGDYTGWYVRDQDSGEYLSGFETWERVEGALIADLCTGALSWLGITQAVTAPGASAENSICRLAPPGLDLIRRTRTAEHTTPSGPVQPPHASPSAPPVVVRPDFSIEVPSAAGLYTRFQMERLAEPRGATSRPVGTSGPQLVYRYHLSAASLGRALARGIRAEQALAFLRQVSDGRVPANVAGSIQAWADRHGQVTLQEVALLHAVSERAMRELRALPQTRALIDHQLSPTTALVRREHLPRLKQILRDLGYLPPEDHDPQFS